MIRRLLVLLVLVALGAAVVTAVRRLQAAGAGRAPGSDQSWPPVPRAPSAADPAAG
jgi:hypothetical protein